MYSKLPQDFIAGSSCYVRTHKDGGLKARNVRKSSSARRAHRTQRFCSVLHQSSLAGLMPAKRKAYPDGRRFENQRTAGKVVNVKTAHHCCDNRVKVNCALFKQSTTSGAQYTPAWFQHPQDNELHPQGWRSKVRRTVAEAVLLRKPSITCTRVRRQLHEGHKDRFVLLFP